MSNFASIIQKHLSYAANNMLLAGNSDGSQDGWMSPDDILSNSGFLTQAEIEALPGFGGGGTSVEFARFADIKSGDGGTFSSGAWRTRDINAIDTVGWASLSNNQIILDAGTYTIWVVCPTYGYVGVHQCKLYNASLSTDLLIGNAIRGYTADVSTLASFSGTFSIDAESLIEVQHRCENSVATYGFGLSVSWGDTTFAQGVICKIQ
jgi:hypothetical protein